MKVQVKECRKSFKFTGMYVITYVTTTEDFFTGKKTEVEHHIFSLVPVEPGERVLEKDFNEDKSKFWVKGVK